MEHDHVLARSTGEPTWSGCDLVLRHKGGVVAPEIAPQRLAGGDCVVLLVVGTADAGQQGYRSETWAENVGIPGIRRLVAPHLVARRDPSAFDVA